MEDGVLRNGQQSGRHQHAAHNHANGKVLTLEVELCGSVSRHHSHERTHQSGNTRVDQGVQHPAPELATGPTNQRAIVLGDGGRQIAQTHGEPQTVAAGHLARRLGRGDDGPVNREQKVDQREDQNNDGDGLDQRGRLHGTRQVVGMLVANPVSFLTSACDRAGFLISSFYGAHSAFTFLSTSV